MHGSVTHSSPTPCAALALGATMLCLSLCSGCSATDKTAAFNPPPALMEAMVLPDRSQVRTQGDLLRLVIADETVIAEGNARLEALRKFAESNNGK